MEEVRAEKVESQDGHIGDSYKSRCDSKLLTIKKGQVLLKILKNGTWKWRNIRWKRHGVTGFISHITLTILLLQLSTIYTHNYMSYKHCYSNTCNCANSGTGAKAIV
jgi:hypothetical protein